MNTEPDPPEDPAISEYKASIASIRNALETETDPAILEDLKDALECECHSAFMYEMLPDAPPPTPEPAEESPENTHPIPNKLSDAIKSDIGEFITAARACIHQLLENAIYVRQELPNVSLPEPLQRDVEALCDTWLAAKHDALTDLDGIAEGMESAPGDLSNLANRCRRVHGILGDVFEPTDRVIQQLRQAAQENARLGLAALLVTESAANILRSTPALPASLEEPDEPGDEDSTDEEIPPGCLAFHAEDELAVKLLIRTLRQLQERPGIPPEDLAGLERMVATLERFPKSLQEVRAGVTLRHQVGEDSSWLEARIEDGEFSLGEGTWSDGDTATETVFEVTESYRDGGFYPAYFFIEKFARWVANPEREIIVEESSDPGDTIPATEPDANLWGKLPGGYL